MTTIYLIRHAEAEGNLYRIAQGQANSIITDRGERQIRALSRGLQMSRLTRFMPVISTAPVPQPLPYTSQRDFPSTGGGICGRSVWVCGNKKHGDRLPEKIQYSWRISTIIWTSGMWRGRSPPDRCKSGC